MKVNRRLIDPGVSGSARRAGLKNRKGEKMNEARVPPPGAIAWWLRLIVFLFVVLFAAGAVIALVHPAMLVSPNDQINGAVRVYAGYMAARNLALALMLFVMLTIGARRHLAGIMALCGLIQVLDACIDCFEARWAVAPGVLVLGLVCLFAAARLCGDSPFWTPGTWNR
jgi:hypothetical protein